jgi:hypothetical protein
MHSRRIETRHREPTTTSLGQPALGELKAQHRESHLCLRCAHHLVCGMAKALDPNLLVTIASCLGFDDAEVPYAEGVVELIPLEPVSPS